MSGGNQGNLTARSEDCHFDSDGEVSYTTKKGDSADNVPVSVSEEEETQMESEDEEKDSKAAHASCCVSGMSGHLIADMGNHHEVICTIRFSNYETIVEDDDRKLPVREVPCASLTRKREVSWEVVAVVVGEEEEEEEEEVEVVIPVNRLIDDRGGIEGDSIGNLVYNVPCTSPSDDIIYYLDREHSDEGLGVFRLLQPEMRTENMELWIYSKSSGLTSMVTSTSEGGVLQDLVVVDEVEQDHSDLDDQFIEEVCSGSNDVTVLTPPNFNEDAYANKLALYPRHQCVDQSPETIKAIEDRDVFFQDVVNSRNITHLRGLPTIRHQAPREKPDNLSLRNGSTQIYMYGNYHVKGKDPNDDRYVNPETGEGENQTFKVPLTL